MKRIVEILLVAIAVASMCLSRIFAFEHAWEKISAEQLDIRALLIDQDNPQIMCIGSKEGIFKTEGSAGTWRNIFLARGRKGGVYFLTFEPTDKRILYAATGNGVFVSHNYGKTWQRIFKGKNYLENECRSLLVLPGAIFVGTQAGLFISRDKGSSWERASGKLGASKIFTIVSHPDEPSFIYVACSYGVFRTEDYARSFKRLFIAQSEENSQAVETEEALQENSNESSSCQIRYLCVDSDDPRILYLATSRGILKTNTQGDTWSVLSDIGLLNQDIRFIYASHKSRLYVVSKSGIFEYYEERWQEVSLRLAASEINFLVTDNQGSLYAATDAGLFRASARNIEHTQTYDTLELYFKGEPTIEEVQAAAIRYAEVAPEKIRLWRKQAAAKALLPELSVGIERDAADLWHWEGGSTTKTGDDILVKGRDIIAWDVRLAWDFSELIWNEDQTSIDVRSRLLVQLRDDVLDEVTKIYFERIRLKMELDNLSIEERKKRLEKELRLKELSACLDALTGGYFSQQLKDRTSQDLIESNEVKF